MGAIRADRGNFDVHLVDGLVRAARAHDLRLVLLWFGSWKNTWSSYAPEWVKRDQDRFLRAELRDGSGTERLSPFSDANRDADARAFAELMRRLREIDDEHTVIMVQVENEVGMIPDARDHSPAANAAYARPVPAELMRHLADHKENLDPDLRALWRAAGYRTEGDWETVFGDGPQTEDLFMAWHYARYIGSVAEAGRAEYPLPMFTNAALIRPDYSPGQYNSGGPLPHSMDVWKAGAPQLDFLAPDIYFEFKKWARKYNRADNALFIPEANYGSGGAANAFFAVGEAGAIGYSPFAIDSAAASGPNNELARSYDVLAQLAPAIFEQRPQGNVAAVLLEELSRAQRIRLGGYTFEIAGDQGTPPLFGEAPASPPPPGPRPYGIFVAVGPDEFYMAGVGLSITFRPNGEGPPTAGLASVEEGRFMDGRWVVGRVLGGDDTGQGNNIAFRRRSGPTILHVELYRYR